MKVKDLMSRDVVTCNPDDTLEDASRLMWERDCGFAPTVDPVTGKLCGVVTDRDMCMATAMRGLPANHIPLFEVMQTNVRTCSADDDVMRAHEIMRDRQVKRIPVTDKQGMLVGVITLNDLALHAAKAGKAEELRDVATTLASISAHRGPPAQLAQPTKGADTPKRI